MNNITPRPLQWSKQLNILPASATPRLRGDKIILPAQALEELLSAATVTVQSSDRPQTTTFDPFNPYSYAAETHARQQLFERQQNLPHPLTFRLVNPENGRVVFAGIREFSATDDSVGLSSFLKESLDIGKGEGKDRHLDAVNGVLEESNTTVEAPARLTIHFQDLPKGTYVKLRPLEAGYDPDDWKALLEQYLRDNFTTLTNKEVINVSAGRENYRFLVDGLKPNDEGISLVDTDIEVDIEPLNEEQARETMQKLAQKSQRAPGSKDGSSNGGLIQTNATEVGQVLPEEYVDYSIKEWDHSSDLEVEAVSLFDGRDIDLFTAPFGPKHRMKPREDYFVFGDLSSRSRKRVKISHSNVELENASALNVSVRGSATLQRNDDQGSQATPIPYSLNVSYAGDSSALTPDEGGPHTANPEPDEEVCSNCRQVVPKRTMFLHQNFCFRNNVLCPQCQNVFQKSSAEWKEHWHCEHDSEHGDSNSSKEKHDRYAHTAIPCPMCDFEAPNALALAHHRTTTCPAKLILCQFCHLQVPQQGPDDPSADSAEVILSGLTPHEVSDGARTTECHLCDKIVRLRDMSAHLRHHDLQRLSRTKPRICRNANCGRTLDSVSKTGEIRPQAAKNDLGICDTCFGPLYVSMYDPDGRALRRRVERKLLTQLLTGCGQSWCRNEFCKTGRQHLGIATASQGLISKDAMQMIRPVLDNGLKDVSRSLNFCTDEASQKRRTLAEMIASEKNGVQDTGSGMGKDKGKSRQGPESAAGASNGFGSGIGSGYAIEWCVAALEVEGGDLDRARTWLRGFAPTTAETANQ